jgi:acyl-CoA synthetase (AMP-forming)/AMP-acid ligase II
VAVVHASVLDRLESILPGARYLRSLLVVADEDAPALAGTGNRDRSAAHGGARGAEGPRRPDAGSAGSAKHRVRIEDFAAYVGRQPSRLEPADTRADDLAGWLFTSGSTGRPKAAVHFHQDFRFNIERYARHVVGYRESDITLSVPKLFFGYATGTNLMFPFAYGGQTALFAERSTPETIFDLIDRHRPTILTSVPTMINAMLQIDGARRKDLSCLRLCLSAGEALPAELYRRWKDAFGVEILTGSDRRRCSTSISRTAPARSGPEAWVASSPATKRASSRPTRRRPVPARRARSGSRAPRGRCATGEAERRRRGPSAAIGA